MPLLPSPVDSFNDKAHCCILGHPVHLSSATLPTLQNGMREEDEMPIPKPHLFIQLFGSYYEGGEGSVYNVDKT